ncbi:SAM-dependent methyltransferase [Micromonospora sp. NPDC023956]|uniref:SAM-dependent methyltransferase n=1 Tax=Micromonospora sp. NPDC023956 TaxID=3155722 RepID=UPI003409AE67
MDRPNWAPEGVDLNQPSIARVYDYFLGGSHNVAADRHLGQFMITTEPQFPQLVKANREFLVRAVRLLVAQGIRQFVDIGSGIPTFNNTHEVAQGAAPDARVVYVDVDPVAVAHSRELLAGNDRVAVIQADVREPDKILGDPALRDLIDLTEPVGVLLLGLLHYIPDSAGPAEIVGRLRDATAPGSFLVLSHSSWSTAIPDMAEMQDKYNTEVGAELTPRSRDEIVALFDGYELVEPGVVEYPDWRPHDGAVAIAPGGILTFYVAVGRRSAPAG